MIRQPVVSVAVAFVLWLANPAHSSTHDFYKGQTMRFIVAFAPGGLFDVYTRAIARHFRKHLPPNPSTIP